MSEWKELYIVDEAYELVKHNRYENTPIQIFRNFHLQKLKIFR